jgi:glycosyltransferase involved in cell wall biosynthesis
VIADADAESPARYDRILVEVQPDLVHAHDAWWGARVCARRAVPFILTLHNCHVWLPDAVRGRARAEDEATSVYACVSEQAARHAMLGMHLDVEKMVLMPSGVDPARLRVGRDAVDAARLRADLELPAAGTLFLSVASILPAKSQRALVKAFARVREEDPGAVLVLLGETINQAYFADVLRTIDALTAPGSVVYRPFTERVSDYYNAADVFVLPSLWEGWSLSLAEAVYCGLPVVATRVGAATAFEGAESVFLVPPPFERIEELNPARIRQFAWSDDDVFVGRLADGMRLAARAPRQRRRLPDATMDMLSAARAYDAYVRMYNWLLQGGSVHGLRRLVGGRVYLA